MKAQIETIRHRLLELDNLVDNKQIDVSTHTATLPIETSVPAVVTPTEPIDNNVSSKIDEQEAVSRPKAIEELTVPVVDSEAIKTALNIVKEY